MLHQPSGGGQGTAADIEIQARELLYIRERMNRIYADCTGQTPEKIAEDLDRDRFMSPDEARAYGLIDHVIQHTSEADAARAAAGGTATIVR
jgi:ATP-dependent Clp protease, protease subunit